MPPEQPFWPQSGRHLVIFHISAAILRRISARISPWGSRPLNLNFFLTIVGTYFWERSIFGPKKALAATKSHLGWNTQVESNLAGWGRQGFQAGGPTTRPDLRRFGGNWENPRRLGNSQKKVPRTSNLDGSAQNFAAHLLCFHPKS